MRSELLSVLIIN